MKAILWLLSLSFYLVGESACQSAIPIGHSVSCDSKLFRDSLIRKYVDSGAEKLPYLYNNLSWDKYLDSILVICPNIAEAYQLKAVPAIKNGEYAKAYMLDEKAAQLDSQQFIPYLGFLQCIFTKDYQGAITHFNESLRILPGGAEMDHSFYFYLGICYLQLHQFSEAEKNFSLDISSQKAENPTGEVHFNSILYMGLLKMESHQADSALIYFKDCLRVYKDLPEANYYLALTYKQQNKLDSTVKYLEIARQSVQDGYSMNEDNQFYVNYPYQITQHEIVELLNLCKK
jgi:tetratricopeptide (TPR) repeat protein